MRVLAAPLGSRRPCSHCSNVRFDTPSNAANWAWVSPDLKRARTIGERGSTTTRFPPPALISRTLSRTSCQIFRFASNLVRARPVSFLGTFKGLLQLSEDMSRDIFLLGLGIQREHPKFIGLIPNEVDHTQPAALAHALPSPA